MNALHERMRTYLSMNRVGVLTVSGREGMWALPVRYRTKNLELDCLLPRWADATYYVQQSSGVLLVILSVFPSSTDDRLCWLQYSGKAIPVASPDWSGLLPKGTSEALATDLYLVVHLVPERIDLLDEGHGWGARETLEVSDTH